MLTETLISHPIDVIDGDISIPGDKSISHRAVMLGAIAEGKTSISGFLAGDDCIATINAFKSMGVKIEQHGTDVTIHGVGKYGLQKPKQPIDCGNSGTSLRLLSGILAAQSFDSSLIGDASLLKRPMNRISEPLNLMGAQVVTSHGFAPLKIHGGTLRGIQYTMPKASAQVKSAILLAGLYAKDKTTVTECACTRDHTERMLKAFSYPLYIFDKKIEIEGIHHLIGTKIDVPGDLSSAAFFIVAATLIPNSCLTLRRIGINPTRIGLLHILNKMGANIRIFNQHQLGEEPVADIEIRYAPLTGIDIPKEWVSLAIDEFPAILIACALAKGQTRLHHASELRHKESDRLSAMADGLRQLNIDVTTCADGLLIQGGVLQGGEVQSLYDHRIAMAFLMAGAVAKAPIIVHHCSHIVTSFPTFLEKAHQINLDIRTVEYEL